MSAHEYEVSVTWTGNLGSGTSAVDAYSRDHEIGFGGAPGIPGTSDPNFGGDPARWNPEQLFLASLSQCHMLFFLSLAAKRGVVVESYEDRPHGTMTEAEGFVSVTLRPRVRAVSGAPELIEKLHERAHSLCFIGKSVRCDVAVEGVIDQVAAVEGTQ